ncbi:Phospholipid phosphatase 5 like protein [Verticillium longisporum]|nr:Phospholipid phosphatase 5 like protein [Verticillium longisporum]
MSIIDRIRGDGIQPTFTRDTVRSRRSCGHFFLGWLRTMWLDLLTMAVLGFATLGPTFTRDTVRSRQSCGHFFVGWLRTMWLDLLTMAVLGFATLGALIIQTLSCVIVKHLIGGFRPYFLAVCMPDISLASSHNSTGLNGVGFHEIMYTSEICTQPDKKLLKTAMTSWPSGHAATAFAGFVFLHLYFNAKLKVWAAYRPAFWKVALTIAPLLGAFLKACVLTIDQAHHWYDILAGSIIGTAQ